MDLSVLGATVGVEYVVGALLAAIFGGGGVAAYFKIKPENNSLVAQAADSVSSAATDMLAYQKEVHSEQERVIQSQRDEIAGLRERMAVLEDRVKDVAELEAQIAALKKERDDAVAAVRRLDQRLNIVLEIVAKWEIPLPPEVAPG